MHHRPRQMEKLMFRRAARSRRHLLAGLIVLTVASACGGSRPAAPVTPATAGSTTSASGTIELPANETFDRAVSRGTRTTTGAPGPRYWQQWTDYHLEAELNPNSKRLTGRGSLTYHNRSPNSLPDVYVQLLHNLFAPGARHNTDVPWSVEGIELNRVAAQGQELKQT